MVSPGVFATDDSGRGARSVGIYLMYDVKQSDPPDVVASAALGGRALGSTRPGFGKVLMVL